jgi:hypothetical protein
MRGCCGRVRGAKRGKNGVFAAGGRHAAAAAARSFFLSNH